MKFEIRFVDGSERKPWIAKIVGPDPKYILKREFVRYQPEGDIATFELEDGYFEINDPSAPERNYLHIVDGKVENLSKDDVVAAVVGVRSGGSQKKKSSRYADGFRTGRL